MSDLPAQQGLTRQFAGRWQIPLLVLSLAALAAGVWRLRPEPKPLPFEQLYAHAESLKKAELYPEASTYAEKLLADPARTPEESRRLHRLLAEVVYAHERGNVVHGQSNAEAILLHSNRSIAEAQAHDASMRLVRGEAWEWLRRPADAVTEYRAALAAGAPQPWAIRKRIVELRRASGDMDDDELRRECDVFLAGSDVPDELGYWAAEQVVNVLARHEKHAEAERFLQDNAARFRGSPVKGRYDYLQALAWFHVGRFPEAERVLRSLRDEQTPADALYPRVGWLLGRVLLAEQAPEYALGFFDETIAQGPAGPFRSACVLGRAEALAGLERFKESTQAYHRAIREATESPYESIIDLALVRQSTTVLSEALRTTGRLPEAMAYLRVAARLAPPSDLGLQAFYTERIADLALGIGRMMVQTSGEQAAEPGVEDGRSAHDYLVEAGDQYLHLADLVNLDEPAATAAAWNAADAFDLAGERLRAADVFETFIKHHPESTKTPDALLRLGQTYQALGRYPDAIERYQRNLTLFPRTPSAIASLVPLAECFLVTGALDKAESTLLRIVSLPPGDPLGLITPAAAQFRDALFGLADLYRQSGQYEKAIARYEEALERYQDDPRADRGLYMLADVYRRSAAQIDKDLRAPANAIHAERLRGMHRRRLESAAKIYSEVIDHYRAAAAKPLSDLDRLYQKLSHLYRADVAFELAQMGEVPDLQKLSEALDLYDQAAWNYQQDPIAMAAYVQMINGHLRLGRIERAQMALQRARWALKNIPDDAFTNHAPRENRAFWEEYLQWLERTPTLTSTPPASG